MPIQSSRVAILGAGKSGLGAARLAHRLGLQPVVFEKGSADKFAAILPEFQSLQIPVVFGLEACDAWLQAEASSLKEAVLSPGMDAFWDLPKRFSDLGLTLVGEIEFAWRELTSSTTVAITGTNGKTTTTALLEHVFQQLGRRSIACGNYGYALSEVACESETYDVLALEVSSFQLETIHAFKPKIAIWLNFAPDHLDRYPDVEAYYQAKRRVFENQGSTDVAILRAGESIEGVSAQVLTFTTELGTEADYQWDGECMRFQGAVIARREDLPFTERHNVENLMAVFGAAHALEFDFPAIVAAAQSFAPGEHRCELVATVGGRRYINDSKATNLHALETCLLSQDEPVVLIAGGKEKGLEYEPLRRFIAQKVSHLILIGEIRTKLRELFEDLVPCTEAQSMGMAVQIATEVALEGQSVVLSPGTSSFDMYSGYAARGEAFRAEVVKILR